MSQYPAFDVHHRQLSPVPQRHGSRRHSLSILSSIAQLFVTKESSSRLSVSFRSNYPSAVSTLTSIDSHSSLRAVVPESSVLRESEMSPVAEMSQASPIVESSQPSPVAETVQSSPVTSQPVQPVQPIVKPQPPPMPPSLTRSTAVTEE